MVFKNIVADEDPDEMYADVKKMDVPDSSNRKKSVF